MLHLVNERTQFQFSKEATTYPLILRNYQTSWEDSYHTLPMSSIHPGWLVALPLLAEVPGVAWVGITEADIENYSGMYLSRRKAIAMDELSRLALLPVSMCPVSR